MFTKICRICNENKSIDEFSVARRNVGGREHQCKGCRWSRRNRNSHSHSSWKNNLFYKYNLTIQQYEEMVQFQDGLCAICKKPDYRRLSVDHSHTTGQVRGLLCNACNRSIGLLGDNLESIRSVLLYLERNDVA